MFIEKPKYIIKYCSLERQYGQFTLLKQGSHKG